MHFRLMSPVCRAGIVSALAAALLAGAAAAEGGDSSPLDVVIFTTPRCEACQQVEHVLPATATRWAGRVRIVMLNLAQPGGEAALERYESHYGLGSVSVPIAFVGRLAIEGGEKIVGELDAAIEVELAAGAETYRPGGAELHGEIIAPKPQPATRQAATMSTQPVATQPAETQPRELPLILRELQEAAQTRPAEPPEPPVKIDIAAAPEDALTMLAFHSPKCLGCKDVLDALPRLLRPFAGRVRVELRDISRMEGLDDLLACEAHYQAKDITVPAVFVGGQYIVGSEEIIAGLDVVMRQELAAGTRTFIPGRPSVTSGEGEEPVPKRVQERFESFTAPAVAVAGLLDGINPCAFTTIVFLISMLAYLGRSKHQLAMVGVGFTAAVFLTYVALGLGLLGAVKAMAVSYEVSRSVGIAVAVLAFGLAAFSLIDFIRFRRSGDFKKLKLGMPSKIRAKVNAVIRTGLSSPRLLLGAFVVGFLVALLESICTGQVYLPTIILLTRSPALRGQAIGYLLLYNLMFILPLVGVLVAAYFGVASERLRDALRSHIGGLKLAMAILFAGLGVLILVTI